MPNVDANLVENLQVPDWDPNRDHSVPWQSGLTGIAYNAKYTGEVGSIRGAAHPPDLKGKVSLLSEMGDTMGFMLRITGADPETFTDEEFGVALDKLQEYVDSGQIRRFTGNDYVRDLNAGNIAACEAWSGDVIAMQYDNPDIKFVIPEEGLDLDGQHAGAEQGRPQGQRREADGLLLRPGVAARLAAWVNYICPVEGAQEAMEKIDASLVDNPLIFPDAEFLSNAMAFMDLDEKTRQQYEQDFYRVIGS